MKTIRMILATMLLLSLQANSYCSSFPEIDFQSLRKISSDSAPDERKQTISTDSQSSFEIPHAPRKAPLHRKNFSAIDTATAASVSMNKNSLDLPKNLNTMRL